MIARMTIVFCMILAASLAQARDSKNSTKIDFEDTVVEGVNKRSYESFSEVSEKGKNGRKVRLYKVRNNFSDQARSLVRETVMTP